MQVNDFTVLNLYIYVYIYMYIYTYVYISRRLYLGPLMLICTYILIDFIIIMHKEIFFNLVCLAFFARPRK